MRWLSHFASVLTLAATVGLIPPAESLAQTIGPPPAPAASSTDVLPALSPEVSVIIAPVRQAIDRIKAAQAKLPPAADDRETLRRLRDRDQAAWLALSNIDFSKIPPDQKAAAKAVLGAEIASFDLENQNALLRILPAEGWFAISRYGADGEEAAYLVVLHGGIDLWARFAPVVGRFADIGEAKGAHFAMLSDRLAVHENGLQSFGSQITCVDGVYQPYPIDDPEHLDERRLKLGLTRYAEFQKTFAGKRC